MKTLNTIQIISKIAKILSKIVFIFCIVGFCGCLLGIVTLPLAGSALEFQGLTLHGILQNEAGMSESALYASMIMGAMVCAAQAVLARFSVHYFDRELADGTPFTEGGARELQRLGILAIAIPLGTQILLGIAAGILSKLTEGAQTELSFSGSVSTGIMLLVMAQLCKYGAYLASQKESQPELTE